KMPSAPRSFTMFLTIRRPSTGPQTAASPPCSTPLLPGSLGVSRNWPLASTAAIRQPPERCAAALEKETSMSPAETSPGLTIVQGRSLAGHASKRGPAVPEQQRRYTCTDNALDWIERLVTLALYAWFVSRIVDNYLQGGAVVNLLFLPS